MGMHILMAVLPRAVPYAVCKVAHGHKVLVAQVGDRHSAFLRGGRRSVDCADANRDDAVNGCEVPLQLASTGPWRIFVSSPSSEAL